MRREVEDRRFDEATDAGQCAVDSTPIRMTGCRKIIAQMNNAPEDVGVSFKLYRNLDSLYDVFGSVVESAGAFGSKDEFQSLSNDMNGLESARRAFGERLQKLAASKKESTQLRAQVKTLTATHLRRRRRSWWMATSLRRSLR